MREAGVYRHLTGGDLVNRQPVRPLSQGKAATDDELDLLLAAARFKPRDLALVMLLANSGCRAGEAAGLQIPDLDLADCAAYVDGKGNKRRRIYYDAETAEKLSAWLVVRPHTTHNYVFTSMRDHGKLSSRAITDVLRRLSLTAGLTRQLGAHSLRHRVGLKFARERVAPRVAQHYLGHSNITTTLEYYQDVDETDLRQAGALLNSNANGWHDRTTQNPASKRLLPRSGTG
ncbi:MAG: site-specific integrase [Anaerolineae bacterium]|nr:site-specific integrase [Anaerolineae bacterium]